MSECIFLGTGCSTGTPLIGCSCKVCTSSSIYNKRLRPAILLKQKNKNILVDIGPDIRYQALKYDIKKLDALMITHAHYDHIAGIDDIRVFNRIQKSPLRCFLLEDAYSEIKQRYDYLFNSNQRGHTQSAQFNFKVLKKDFSEFNIGRMKFKYFSYYQDSKKVMGFRVDNFAYVTDIKRYDDKIFEYLKNLDILVLSCLRPTTSAVHFGIEEAIAFSRKVKAKKTYLTHLAHEMNHSKLSNELPKNIYPAYDGLILHF